MSIQIACGVVDIPIPLAQRKSMNIEEKIAKLREPISRYDPIFGHPVAVHKLFPDAPPQDFGSHDDCGESDMSSLGVAHDLIGCMVRGEAGTPACNHSGDHLTIARAALNSYANDKAQKHNRVRFASE